MWENYQRLPVQPEPGGRLQAKASQPMAIGLFPEDGNAWKGTALTKGP